MGSFCSFVICVCASCEAVPMPYISSCFTTTIITMTIFYLVEYSRVETFCVLLSTIKVWFIGILHFDCRSSPLTTPLDTKVGYLVFLVKVLVVTSIVYMSQAQHFQLYTQVLLRKADKTWNVIIVLLSRYGRDASEWWYHR